MPKGIRNLQITFGERGLSHFGGMILFQRFCRKLNLRRLLQRTIPWKRKTNLYHSSELFLSILYSMIAGLKRISDTRILHYNGSFCNIVGLAQFPSPSNLRDFLKSVTPQTFYAICRLHDQLKQKMFVLPKNRTSLIFDFDSTVLPLYGFTTQGARKGYNPKKHGRPCYHPLVSFEGHTQDCWHGMLRAGNTYPTTAVKRLYFRTKKIAPKYLYRIRLRADEAFYDWDFVHLLDEESISYVICAKLTKPIQEKIVGLPYHRMNSRWEVSEFTYQPHGWKVPHRFVVVRQPKPEKAETSQLTLWTFKEYAYHVFVTNLSIAPAGVYRFYKARGKAELDIRELKWSFPLGKVPTRTFLGNALHLELILFAYNLLNWFKRLCLPKKFHHTTLQTLRSDFLVLPARLVRSGHKNTLKLPQGYVHQKLFYHVLEKVEKLKF